MKYSIRKVAESDWRVYSEVRLRALKTDPNVFGSNHDRESKFTEQEWRELLENSNSAVFVVFADEQPVGMTGVAVDRNDPSGKTAILWGSWLEPEARGKGLSGLLYEARIDWAKYQPTVERIIVSHRESNVASKFANQKFGFVCTHTTEKVWNDGVVEHEFHYERLLTKMVNGE